MLGSCLCLYLGAGLDGVGVIQGELIDAPSLSDIHVLKHCTKRVSSATPYTISPAAAAVFVVVCL